MHVDAEIDGAARQQRRPDLVELHEAGENEQCHPGQRPEDGHEVEDEALSAPQSTGSPMSQNHIAVPTARPTHRVHADDGQKR